MKGRTNASINGGVSARNALIRVHSPTDSTVTISKGGVVLKVLDATKGVPDSGGNGSLYYYSVSSNNYGELTISNGTYSATVAVTSNLLYDVSIINLPLFDNGVFLPGYSHQNSISNGGTVTYPSGSELRVLFTMPSSGARDVFEKWNEIDLTQFTNITAKFTQHTGADYFASIFVATSASVMNARSASIKTRTYSSSGGDVIINLDITSLSGAYYVGAGIDNDGQTGWKTNRIKGLNYLIIT